MSLLWGEGKSVGSEMETAEQARDGEDSGKTEILSPLPVPAEEIFLEKHQQWKW